MTNKPRALINLDHAFNDPALTKESIVAVFKLKDGTRVEFAVLDADSAYTERGPRLERHQLLIARGDPAATVELAQFDELTDLIGMPELTRALDLYKQGKAEAAARYARAAGPRWAALAAFFLREEPA
jgi:phytoene dehydrogenase-like protein